MLRIKVPSLDVSLEVIGKKIHFEVNWFSVLYQFRLTNDQKLDIIAALKRPGFKTEDILKKYGEELDTGFFNKKSLSLHLQKEKGFNSFLLA